MAVLPGVKSKADIEKAWSTVDRNGSVAFENKKAETDTPFLSILVWLALANAEFLLAVIDLYFHGQGH